MINYKTKKELSGVYVCLHNAHDPEPFTVELLINYVNACNWQLSQGITPKRVPFFISAIPSECDKAINDLIHDMQAKRRSDNQSANKKETGSDTQGMATVTVIGRNKSGV